MVFLTCLLILVAIAFLLVYLGKNDINESARQCSYGDTDIGKLLLNPNGYSELKLLMFDADSFDRRYFVSLSISREFPEELLKEWLSTEPTSDALLCYGAHLVQKSWSVRGYGRGYEVKQEKWEKFYESLARTREVLLQCAESNPKDPTPWAYLIMISTWSSDDMDTRSYYFDQAILRDQNNWAAHLHMIIALSEKWGGSNDRMIDFAETVADEAEDGSDLPIILLKAYIEHWKYLDVFIDQPEKAQAFIDSHETKSRAVAVYNKSLGSKYHRNSSTSIFARYNASSWFWIVKDRELLKRELDELGDTIENIHWRWAGSEGELKAARNFTYNR